MAWPYTTRHTTYTALKQITSAYLNDIQDKIIDLYEEHANVEINVPLVAAPQDGSNEWDHLGAIGVSGHYGLRCNSYDFATTEWSCHSWPNGMKLNHIDVYWSSGGSGATTDLSFYVQRIHRTGSSFAAQALNSSGTTMEISATTGSIVKDTYTCDQNNTSFDHADDQLVITLRNADANILSYVDAIVLDVDFFNINKYCATAESS